MDNREERGAAHSEAAEETERLSKTGTSKQLTSRRSFVATAIAAATALGATACTPFWEKLAGAGSTARTDSEAAVAQISDEPAAPPEPEEVRITLRMIGDILMHRRVWESGYRQDGSYNYDHLFAQVAEEWGGADISVVNQETILGGTAMGLSGYPTFCSPQEVGDAEAAVGLNVALSGTNHALDKGFAGIQSELNFWRTNHPDITVLGIADSEELANTVHIVEANGIKVGVLNYTYDTNGIPLPTDEPWCVKTFDNSDVPAEVARARELGADFVVAFPHWGTEYLLTHDDSQEAWAQMFVNAGVDAIIGDHPHVIEPVEVLESEDGKRVPVFWSIGNFVSTQTSGKNMVGGIASIALVKKGDECRVSEYSFTPTVTHIASGTDFTAYKLRDYTEELAYANQVRYDDGNFSLAWCQSFVQQVLGEGVNNESWTLYGEL